jgi:hypothetical protein
MEKKRKEEKEQSKDNKICPDCNGIGYTFKRFGKVETCWRCLKENRLG